MNNDSLQIHHLADRPQFLETVSRWIFEEFIDPSRYTFEAIKERFRRSYRDRLPLALVALRGSDCVGTVSLFENDLKIRPDLTPWLAALYVRPEARNQGVGRFLIDQAISQTRRFDYPILYLRTETAGEYYRRLGWQLVAETRDEDGTETAVYSLEL